MIGMFYWDPNPEAFKLPFLHWSILWYGVLFAAGFAVAFPCFVSVLTRFFREIYGAGKWRKLAVTTADRLTLYVIVGTVVGARLGHFLFYESPARYLRHPIEILQIRQGGLASHGAVIALIVALVWFAKRMKIKGLDWLKLLDLVSVPTALVGSFIRLGNFVNQEILGRPSDLPWAVVFGHPADGRGGMVPRHPVQIYEALFYLALFFLLWRLSYRREFLVGRGRLVGIFLVTTFGGRFFLEFLKEEQSRLMGEGSVVTMGQLLSIPVVVLGLIFYFWERKR